MEESEEPLVPPHLKELIQTTPSGTRKLIAAWDGLAFEAQIMMLAAKKKNPGPG